MRKIGLIGFGDLGKQIKVFLIQNGYHHNDFLYFDDDAYTNQEDNYFKFHDYLNPEFKDCEFLVCLGYKHLQTKIEILNILLEKGYTLHRFIHPSAYVNPGAQIKKGTVIYPMCNIDANVIIESGTLLNNSVVISHDSILGKGCFLAPSVCVCGSVNIGESTFVGANATLTNGIEVGRHCIIGMSTSLTRSIPDDSKVIGNPFTFVKKIGL